MEKYKNIALVVVVLVIGFNIFDYFVAKDNSRNENIAKCSEKFRITNPDVSEIVADEYCKCVLKTIGEKYKNSKIPAEKIIENEKLLMNDCFVNAKK